MKVNIRNLFVMIFSALLLCGCGGVEEKARDYGVFLSLSSSDIDKIEEYDTVVIDAQYFSAEDISRLKEQGSTVYSYINVGSIEKFRDYYDEYSHLALGAYENWDEEQWINAASPEWQEFLVSLEEELLDKNIDGFFVDNCDVYYVYPRDDIFEGLTAILKHLMAYGRPVIINGGDTFVTEYREKYGSLKHIMTGVNQESVWSRIDFETGGFSAQTAEDRAYFQEYIEMCGKEGLDVYLIEYTKDEALKKHIEKYCLENRFRCYISDSIELDA